MNWTVPTCGPMVVLVLLGCPESAQRAKDTAAPGEADSADTAQTGDSGCELVTWYADADGDGAGTPLYTQDACALPDGYVDNADDCDDANRAIHPDAPERCDGVDGNCDGTIDEGASDALTWFADTDGDGFGDVLNTVYPHPTPGRLLARAG